MDANNLESGAYLGALQSGVAGAVAQADVAGYRAKAQAQQQYAMNLHVAGMERQVRVQVLSLAVSANSSDAVAVAEQFWAFITAGDPAPPSDAEQP